MFVRKKKNQSIIEWAIILPFLLLVLVSILEIGPLMNNVLKVEKTVQYSARQGAIHGNTNEDIRDAFIFSMQGVVNPDNLVSVDNMGTSSGTKISGFVEKIDGIDRTTIEIIPGEIDKRINGGWVMVRANYYHRIYTPLLQTVLDFNGSLIDDKYFPIPKYAIYRVE